MRISGLIISLMLFISVMFNVNAVDKNNSNDIITLTEKSTVFLYGPIHYMSVTSAIIKLEKALNDTKGIVYLVLNSGGGSAESALQMRDYLISKPKNRLKVIAIKAGSAASFIYETADKERLWMNYSELWFHVGSARIDFTGNYKDRVTDVAKFFKGMYSLLAESLKISSDDLMDLLNREFSITPFGHPDFIPNKIKFADRLVTVTCDKSLLLSDDAVFCPVATPPAF